MESAFCTWNNYRFQHTSELHAGDARSTACVAFCSLKYRDVVRSTTRAQAQTHNRKTKGRYYYLSSIPRSAIAFLYVAYLAIKEPAGCRSSDNYLCFSQGCRCSRPCTAPALSRRPSFVNDSNPRRTEAVVIPT